MQPLVPNYRDEAVAIVRDLILTGVEIKLDDTGRQVQFRPVETVPPSLQERLANAKWAVISYLETDSGWVDMALSTLRDPVAYEELRFEFDECAAVREFEVGNTRELAEEIAVQHFIERVDRWIQRHRPRAEVATIENVAMGPGT